MKTLKQVLDSAVNEKDVENSYRSAILESLVDGEITSPYGIDGLLEATNIRSLLEFKYNLELKQGVAQANVLTQCLYYLKKFENAGHNPPSTLFVGDKNECFALHTNSLNKYLSSEIDWEIAPSNAHRKNPDLVKAIANDVDITPFVFDIDHSFDIKEALDKIKELSESVQRKVRVTKNNIGTIYEYFLKNVVVKSKLKTNELANLFVQILINPDNNYLHPTKNVLVSETFGNIQVNRKLFISFFSHFEGAEYSPKEKEAMTGLVDRLVEDTTRRSKGEFFTPSEYVNLAHEYISKTFGEDWKEKYTVWDCASGTSNLTRDYRFKDLYVSSLEQSDIDTTDQMGYNPEATKFQYDFLNDDFMDLPKELIEDIQNGKEILFFINPPYATSCNFGESNKENMKTLVNDQMKKDGWGACSQNLYAQFIYKMYKIQQVNKNVKICMFTPANYMSGSTFKKLRKHFLNSFGFQGGFQMQASEFSDVADDWAIIFGIFDSKS